MSLESNNYVYYSANSYFLPMCVFRNHSCLCTTTTGKQQKLCRLGKQMIPGVLLRSISHCLHPQPLGDIYTSGQGEDLLALCWGPLPSLTHCVPCKAHVTTKTPLQRLRCVGTQLCCCQSACLPQCLTARCLEYPANREYKAQGIKAVPIRMTQKWLEQHRT